MLHVSPSSKRQTALLIAAFALSTLSLNAQADLTPYTRNGANLVYSSVSDVTWTQDGNLLATLFANQGYQSTVNAIIAISPTVTNIPNAESPTGTYTLTSNDFSISGTTTWFGALAYINYLNSISYGGIKQWYLPTAANTSIGYNTSTNGTAKGDELVELYYQELGSKGFFDTNGNKQANVGINDTNNIFTNEQTFAYWSATQYAPVASSALLLNTIDGEQQGLNKSFRLNAWAVTQGRISAVPEPERVLMLLLGLGVMCSVVHRRQGRFINQQYATR